MSKPILFLSIIMLSTLHFTNAQVTGCTDSLAENYLPNSKTNDGSCSYKAITINVRSSVNIPKQLNETSGLILWNNLLWTHNDNDDNNLYALDTLSGNIFKTIALPSTSNIDWEEISQDNESIYIGDFGNNAKGNRTDLKIYKIQKKSITEGNPKVETIQFSYSNQSEFNSKEANNTDFDCEAFIITADSIYLFTKQWISNKSAIYSLPKTSGKYVAKYKHTLDTKGLITGATYIEDKNLIALCGYNKTLKPFIYLIYDFSFNNLSTANKRKISVNLPFHQVEGIATSNGLKYYISNEHFNKAPIIDTSQKLSVIELDSYTNPIPLKK